MLKLPLQEMIICAQIVIRQHKETISVMIVSGDMCLVTIKVIMIDDELR